MSSRSEVRRSQALFVLTTLLLTTQVGCWEQWSDSWFPQMKRQKSVQAYEAVPFEDRVEAFTPPDGSVPADGGEAPLDVMDEAASNALENPRPMSLTSLENGRLQYTRYCSTCHGAEGMGDGPVSVTGALRGPFGGVLALNGAASIARVRSDGHIYTTIRYGRRRMPSYQRIPSLDRWDIVNFIRYLNEQKGIAK
ncbi:MAG: cytochrome c [Myxococcales bacterium]|nr:cytochrome c [Myxococcales bacterium]MDH5306872.1 cytochrome c [Myxococcales bacterium]MDH5567977.1 cytochrome c [Myxococcales bacterium]